MQATAQTPSPTPATPSHCEVLGDYRFRVCADPESFAAALAVRRRVYNDSCGYDVPIPDSYDERSWLLLAEHVPTGEAVGTMRITPRSVGPIEAEEYFRLPTLLRSSIAVEVNRFAILPAHRKSGNLVPSVSFGLFKLMINFVMDRLGADFVIVCSKEERIWTYEWLRFQRTGMVARYTKLGNAEHSLLVQDLRHRLREHTDHRLWDFLFENRYEQITVPAVPPGLGPNADHPSEPVWARSA